MSVLGAAALGFGLGVVTGMPLGVINVAIVDAVVAGERRHAAGLGLGGAAADTVHALLAFVGVGGLIAGNPSWMRALAIAAAIVILGYAVGSWRRREARVAPATTAAPRVASGRSTSLARGVVTGVALTLPNPGALAAWVAVAASLWPDASGAEAALLAAGVGAGSALWFTVLGRAVARLPRDHRVLRALPRLALLALVGIAGVGVVRAFT